MSDTTRAAIYLRLEPGEDAEPHLAELRAFAFALGVDVIGELIDVGRAGDDEARKKLDAVEALIEAGAISAVLTTELHRLARHAVTDLRESLATFAAYDARLIATRDEVDTSEPRGPAIVEAFELVGRVETTLARQRIKVGIEKHRAKPGARHGRPRGVSTEAVVALRQEGYTMRRICEELGVSMTTVKGRLREWREAQPDADGRRSTSE